MKTLKILLVGAVALIAFASCESDELDDAYYASHASITSSDPNFTSDSDGGTIHFKAEGGEVTILVSCDTEFSTWLVQEYPVTFTIRKEYIENSCYHLTVIAEQNLFMQEQTGKVELATLSGINFAVINIIQDACDSPITIGMNEWNAPAVGELSTTITVTSTGEWTFSNEADWLTVDKTETGITLTANENTEVTERSCEVVLTGTDGVNSVSETITVTQDGLAYITLSDEELLLSNSEGAISVTVESNFEWTYNCDADWVTIEKDEEKSSMKITYTANATGIDRETVVTITAGDGASNIAEAELKITQSWENIDALILEYTITSNNTTIELPIFGGGSVTIDWDDGQTESSSSLYYTASLSHKYTTPGIYSVSISGSIPEIKTYYSDGKYGHLDVVGREYLTAVKQWGRYNFSSMEYAFYKCTNLVSLPEGAGPFSRVTSFRSAFESYLLTTIPENIFSNCQSVTSFQGCFSNCSSLASVPENIFSNCPSVTSFASCFSNCSSLASIPENIFSNCPSVTSFASCFSNCSSLTSIPENIFSNCPSVTSFASCFSNCSSLTDVSEDIFSSCPSVTSFAGCFNNCSSLTSIPENIFSNCPSVTSFASCFNNCSSLISVPENIFSNRSNVTTFYRAFYNCSSLVSAPSFANCSAVTTFEDTFNGCASLATVPENIFTNCTAATTFGSCFYGCSNLKSIPINMFDGILNIADFSKTFYDCSSVVEESPYTVIEVGGETVNVHIYDRSDYAAYMRYYIPTSYKNCFTNSSFSDIDSIPSSWGGNGN